MSGDVEIETSRPGSHHVGSDGPAGPLTGAQRRWLLVLLLLVITLGGLNAGGHSYAIDNEVQFQTTRSLVQLKAELESLDSAWVESPVGPYRERSDGGFVGIVGIGQSIVAAPFYATSRVAAQVLPVDDRDNFIRTGTFFTNTVVLALLAVVVVLLGLELTSSFWGAYAVGLAYTFGTYAFPHAKTFFTEPTSALLVTLGVLVAARWRREASPWLAAACGFLAGFGVMVRVSAALFVPIFAVWFLAIAWRRGGPRRAGAAIVAFAAGGLIPLAAFLLFNWWRFGSPTDLGYPSVPQSFPLLEGLTNQFFRPGKSLFLFAPIIVLGLAGYIAGFRRDRMLLGLMGAIVAANLVFFSRVPFWAGDAAFGPRYQQMVLPLMCVPAVVFAGRRWFRPAVGTLGVVGALVPALLGSLIYFNVLFIEAGQAGVSSAAITDTAEWQPFVRQAELVPAGVRDVFDANRPDERDRGEYVVDPATHYGYFGWEPRLDFWWLWIEPMGSSPLLYVYLVPLSASGLLAALIATGRVRGPAGHRPAHVLGDSDDDDPPPADNAEQ